MYSEVSSMGVWGIEAYKVTVETGLSKGKIAFDIVGLPDTSVRESRERVRSAITTNGFKFPNSARIIVNLAPADVKKEGSVYDLPILVSLLKSLGELDCDTSESVFVGELSLKGDIRPVKGLLSMTIKAKELGYKKMFVPAVQVAQATIVEGIEVYAVESVEQLISHLRGDKLIKKAKAVKFEYLKEQSAVLDFLDVAGQSFARRAVEIACAGGHNLLMIGPPGSGKSMIAKRIPTILPSLTFDEAIECSEIHSVAGKLTNEQPMVVSRPFRAPHHTVSAVALAGGGATPTPGEVSLAHNGVLFLDELPEFSRKSMETLRQPLEDGAITISRVQASLTYPCSVMFVAAMNPCPCGYFGHPTKECTCSEVAVNNYLNKVSGPLLDRIDIQIEVPPVSFDELDKKADSEDSKSIRERVEAAREIQTNRFENDGINCNSQMTPTHIKKYCVLEDSAKDYLKRGFERLSLSARAYDRILKLARTIADIDRSEIIKRAHIAEAFRLRALESKYWSKS